MRTFILAGGLGTRLRDVTGEAPKSMAQVAGRPFLAYLLLQLRRDGFRDVVVLTGYGADAIERYFGTGGSLGVDITYSREPLPLGTGGALRLAATRSPGERYLVMNGDSFLDIHVDALVHAHRSAVARGAVATVALARVPDAARFGTVEIDARGTVTRFVEKSAGSRGDINAGIYVLEASVIEAIEPDRPVSLEREILAGLVGRGLMGIPYEAAFADIGVPESYRALCADPEPLIAASS